MKRLIPVGDRNVAVHYGRILATQGDWLDGVVRGIAAERGADFFTPGRRIQLGWSILTLVEVKGELQLHEPDFSRDPFTDTRKDLSCTLVVIGEQNDVVNPLGVEPLPVTFQDKITVTLGSLDAEEISVQRKKPGEHSSGWVTYFLEKQSGEPDYGWVYVYHLLEMRPGLLKVLTLPVGYIAVFTGNDLERIVDDQDQQVYPKENGMKLSWKA